MLLAARLLAAAIASPRCLPARLEVAPVPQTVSLSFAEAGSRLKPTAPPIVLLHGLFGAGGNFASWAAKLDASLVAASDPRRIMLVDLRNHGRSPHNDDMSFAALAADVVQLLDAQGIERAILFGHSIGGKAAMATALLYPQRVERLLVLDMAPAEYDVEQCEQWAAIDKVISAMRGLRLEAIRTKGDADVALSRAVADAQMRAFILTNLVRTTGASSGDAAAFRWRVNLPAIAAALPALGRWDVTDAVYGGNTLFIGAGKSDFLRTSKHLPAIQEQFSRFSLSTIRSADHWIHADEPEALLLIALKFLSVPGA